MKHTPTPWKLDIEQEEMYIGGPMKDIYSIRNKKEHICYVGSISIVVEEEIKANAHRIVACVNACEGMEDPANEIAELRARVAELENPWISVEEVGSTDIMNGEHVWVAHEKGVCKGRYVKDRGKDIWLTGYLEPIKATHFMLNRVPQPPKQ